MTCFPILVFLMFLTQPTSPGSPNNTIQSIKQPGALSFCMTLPRAWRSPRCSMHQGRYSLKEKQFSKHFCNFPPFVNFLLKIQWGWIMKTPPHSVTENDLFSKKGIEHHPPPLFMERSVNQELFSIDVFPQCAVLLSTFRKDWIFLAHLVQPPGSNHYQQR